ncbi:sugar phosphate isomerase/epimerase [Rugosimonospora acidiphila]|uniref:Sugar phosphate isomerase/epimerase n=1 Tax=Rugosimonospora acidiphila TaxID=556531 RepID=A0ABP9SHW7_9ACTN
MQLYSVREELAADRAGTLRRLADIGYGSVEPCDLADDPEGFRALLDETGLAACSAHAPVLTDAREQVAAAAATIGIDTVIVPFIPPDEFADADGVRRSARALNEAATWAGGHGLRLGYHNHHWELSSLIDGRPALEVLADQLSSEVFLELDVYWAAVGGVDVPELLARLGDRVKYLHVKDGPATKEDPMTAVGAGTLPIPDILAAAPRDAWRVAELDRCATDMLTALAESYAYLNGLEKEAA